MPLAPVRPPVEREHHVLDQREVLLERPADVLVHRDVRGLAAVSRRQQRVVTGGEAHLDRERHRQPPALDQRPHRRQRLDRARTRQRPLRLDEAHFAFAAEHPVAVVEPGAAAHRGTGQPGQRRLRRREPATGPLHQLERPVVQQLVGQPGPPRGRRRCRLVGPVRGHHQRAARPRHRVELDVVVPRPPARRARPARRAAAAAPPACAAGTPAPSAATPRSGRPSAPSDTWAAGSSSGRSGSAGSASRCTVPSAATSRPSTNADDRLPVPRTRPVGRGRQRTRHRLLVDVAEVLQRPAVRVQRDRQVVQRHAGLHPRDAVRGHVDQPVQARPGPAARRRSRTAA